MLTTTPQAISSPIRVLCAKLSSHAPEFLPIRMDTGANVDDCFLNVADKVSKDGGQLVHGWTIWEWAGVMIEAEFHAVWESPSGERVDITPKADGEDRILFLPDPGRTWSGEYVDNVRHSLIQPPSVLFGDLEEASRRRVALYNRSERTSQGVAVNGRELQPLLEVMNAAAELLNGHGNIHSPCPCGSGRKYKNCHRRLLSSSTKAV
jgi:hypothetical protein